VDVVLGVDVGVVDGVGEGDGDGVDVAVGVGLGLGECFFGGGL